MNERYVQVNIGRGELSRRDWAQFQADAKLALRETTRGTKMQVFRHLGTGVYEGIPEQSAHISTFADVDTYALRVRLSLLARKFHQKAIALIVGSDLIFAPGEG